MRLARYVILYVLYCFFYYMIKMISNSQKTNLFGEVLVSGLIFLGIYILLELFIKKGQT